MTYKFHEVKRECLAPGTYPARLSIVEDMVQVYRDRKPLKGETEPGLSFRFNIMGTGTVVRRNCRTTLSFPLSEKAGIRVFCDQLTDVPFDESVYSSPESLSSLLEGLDDHWYRVKVGLDASGKYNRLVSVAGPCEAPKPTQKTKDNDDDDDIPI